MATSHSYIFVNNCSINVTLDMLESLEGHLNKGKIEASDDIGDVGVHLVKVGVLGGCLPVLAASHGVHNVLSEKE